MTRARAFKILGLFLLAGILASCASEKKPTSTKPADEMSTCLSSVCHGSPELQKTVSPAAGGPETVPLYVDRAAYRASVHGAFTCTQCHTDIVLRGGTHAPVAKGYGGWGAFSAMPASLNGEALTADQEGTRNYTTQASLSCSRDDCHAGERAFYGSAHFTIFKLRAAATTSIGGHQVGGDYAPANCLRCHATCSTCHFGSQIVRRDTSTDDILNHWDGLQHNGDADDPLYKNLTSYGLDWTANIRTHQFRTASNLRAGSEVCQVCHSGYLKPPATGYRIRNDRADSLKATEVWGNPQAQGLARPASAHQGKQCAECHDGVHSYPGTPYDWATGGDVHCTDCHTAQATGHPANVADGYSHRGVACVACHTTGLARDLGQAGHNVWKDPATNVIRPVLIKYGQPVSWTPHTWEAEDESAICATKCHYAGNLVGAYPRP
jgi:hypothetical protein